MLYSSLVTAGGAERQCLEEARHLLANGHEVTIVTFALADRAIFVPQLRDMIQILPERTWPQRVLALRRLLRSRRPDLLVAHTSPELTWLVTRATRVPYVLYHNSPPFYIGPHSNPALLSRRYRRVFESVRHDVDGYEEIYSGRRPTLRSLAWGELRALLKHFAFRDAEALIVLSERTRRELRALHGVRAVAVRGCLPSDHIELPTRDHARRALGLDGDPILLSVCRLEPVKRVRLLLQAFARVRKELPKATLIVVGEGPERDQLVSLANSLELGASVRFASFVSDDELWTYYAAADLFAAPAMADFNIAPYEALAAGAKVVWTNEMETDKRIEASGLVFSITPNAASLAEGIITALAAPQGCVPDFAEMTWAARVARLEPIYRAAAAGRATSARH